MNGRGRLLSPAEIYDAVVISKRGSTDDSYLSSAAFKDRRTRSISNASSTLDLDSTTQPSTAPADPSHLKRSRSDLIPDQGSLNSSNLVEDLKFVGDGLLGQNTTNNPELHIDEVETDAEPADSESEGQSDSTERQSTLRPNAPFFTPTPLQCAKQRAAQQRPWLTPASNIVQPKRKKNKGPKKRASDLIRIQARSLKFGLWWLKFPPYIKHVPEDIVQHKACLKPAATFPCTEKDIGPLRAEGYVQHKESADHFKVYKEVGAKALSTAQTKDKLRFLEPYDDCEQIDASSSRVGKAAFAIQRGSAFLLRRSSISGSKVSRKSFTDKWKIFRELRPPVSAKTLQEWFSKD